MGMTQDPNRTPDHAEGNDYVPGGAEQIVRDELRLRGDARGELGRCWVLSALGHQLRAEPDLVENSLHIVVAHGDQAVVTAASTLASILLDGVPRAQLTYPIEFPIAFAVPDDADEADRMAWLENVKVASAVVSAYAAGDAGAIQQAAVVLCGDGVLEVLAVLVTAAVRKLDRHVSWFGEAMRAAERSTAPGLLAPGATHEH